MTTLRTETDFSLMFGDFYTDRRNIGYLTPIIAGSPNRIQGCLTDCTLPDLMNEDMIRIRNLSEMMPLMTRLTAIRSASRNPKTSWAGFFLRPSDDGGLLLLPLSLAICA